MDKVLKIAIFFLFLLLIILFGMSWYYLFYKEEKKQKTKSINTTALSKHLKKIENINVLYALDPIKIITKDSKTFYIKIDFEISLAELKYELHNKDKKIKQTIKEIFKNITLEYIYTVSGKNDIKKQIKDKINSFLVDGKIINVYITSIKSTI
jgi:flagellar FliL protein